MSPPSRGTIISRSRPATVSKRIGIKGRSSSSAGASAFCTVVRTEKRPYSGSSLPERCRSGRNAVRLFEKQEGGRLHALPALLADQPPQVVDGKPVERTRNDRRLAQRTGIADALRSAFRLSAPPRYRPLRSRKRRTPKDRPRAAPLVAKEVPDRTWHARRGSRRALQSNRERMPVRSRIAGASRPIEPSPTEIPSRRSPSSRETAPGSTSAPVIRSTYSLYQAA